MKWKRLIPASLKMKIVDETTHETTEKRILRKACEDLPPPDLVWRIKAQFDVQRIGGCI